MLIYGRYTEVVAPALIAFGLAALPQPAVLGRRLAWPLAGFGALTALVVLIRATASDPDAANRWNISALPFVTVQLGPAILIGAALVALGGRLAAAAGRRPSARSAGSGRGSLVPRRGRLRSLEPRPQLPARRLPAGMDQPQDRRRRRRGEDDRL